MKTNNNKYHRFFQDVRRLQEALSAVENSAAELGAVSKDKWIYKMLADKCRELQIPAITVALNESSKEFGK